MDKNLQLLQEFPESRKIRFSLMSEIPVARNFRFKVNPEYPVLLKFPVAVRNKAKINLLPHLMKSLQGLIKTIKPVKAETRMIKMIK